MTHQKIDLLILFLFSGFAITLEAVHLGLSVLLVLLSIILVLIKIYKEFKTPKI